MKLKVICQRCGKTAEIQTYGATRWRVLRPTDFSEISREADDMVDSGLSFDVWVCPSCNRVVSGDRERAKLALLLFGDML